MSQPDPVPKKTPTGPSGSYLSSLKAYPKPAWRAAIACVVATSLSPAALVATITFMVDPISAEMRWSPAETLGLFALPLLVAPLLLPFAGRWVDRWGARAVAVPGAVVYGVATGLVMWVGTSKLQLGALLVVSTATGYMAILAVVYKVVSAWFPKHRGSGFSVLIGAAASLSGAVVSPLCQLAVSAVGWRTTYLGLGLIILLVLVPCQIVLLSEPADVRRARADGPTRPDEVTALPGVPLSTAVRTRAWLFAVVALAIGSGAVMSVRQNAVSLLGERGFSAEVVALALSALLVSSVVGQIVAGVVLDRSRSPRASVPFFVCTLAGLVVVVTLQGSVAALFVAMCLLGVTLGAESTIGPYLIGRYFGLRAFGQIQGLTLGITILAIGLVPTAVAAVEEQTGSYTGPLMALIAAVAVAVVLAFALPRYPEQTTGDPSHVASKQTSPS